MNSTKLVSTRLPADIAARLERLAAESCRTRAAYLRQIILRYLRLVEADPDKKI